MSANTRDYVTLALLLLVGGASGLDIVLDLRHGAPGLHVVVEGILFGGAGVMLAWILRDLRARRQRIQRLEGELATAQARAARRPPHLEHARQQLRDAVEVQFREWGLTESERAVGWLLLKGLSVKEIAGLRGTHEKTVRQQASSIYHKADLPGRHAFAAWLIEDML
jgi:DNA-binding CsgD family transcriptional regulator